MIDFPFRPLIRLTLLLVFSTTSMVLVAAEPAHQRPTMGDFMGVNGHTIQFKPDLYSKVCRQVRDYHSFEWDMGNDTDYVPRFPEARNRVNWDIVYGSWQKAGFTCDVCIMFNNTPPNSWKNLEADAHAYGLAFAKAFGPSSAKKLVSSMEIGNEPGKYSDEQYRKLFHAMASGAREGDPKLKILTCNMTTGKSGDYEKTVQCVEGLDSVYDVLNIHTYAMADGWPTWRRTYPEDPQAQFLKTVESLIQWRNNSAKGKEVWVTEFGWDASTKPKASTGEAAKWDGNVSDEQQAQYLVRSFLLFAEMDLQKAFLYFFNDSNEPSFHAASGITRNFEPKPSFHAVAHLYRTLGDFRFQKVVARQPGQLYAYQFTHAKNPQQSVIVAWSPTKLGDQIEVTLPVGTAKVRRTEQMPLTDNTPIEVNFEHQAGSVKLSVTGSPVYLWLDGQAK